VLSLGLLSASVFAQEEVRWRATAPAQESGVTLADPRRWKVRSPGAARGARHSAAGRLARRVVPAEGRRAGRSRIPMPFSFLPEFQDLPEAPKPIPRCCRTR